MIGVVDVEEAAFYSSSGDTEEGTFGSVQEVECIQKRIVDDGGQVRMMIAWLIEKVEGNDVSYVMPSLTSEPMPSLTFYRIIGISNHGQLYATCIESYIEDNLEAFGAVLIVGPK